MWPFPVRKKKLTADGAVRTHTVKLQARYDAAQTTAENRRHWANADNLSADAAASADVRKTLRERARYEFANNSYCNGIAKTQADFCVGTGPRLQLLTRDASLNELIEAAFVEWAEEINLAEKLHTMRIAKLVDGEAFAVFKTNTALASPIKLDLVPVEADRVSTPYYNVGVMPMGKDVDGIILDDADNPAYYTILRHHPGQPWCDSGPEADIVPADQVTHWFRADRAGQHRGVPEITPALPLFAQLRRYTLAVLGAAETAADFAAVLYTTAPADGEAAPVDPMDLVELERRMATTLPDGWQLGQVKAEQPTTTYGEFKKEVLNEIARCLSIPYNIAACNSSGYNYASGRLDHQTFFKSVRIEQASLARRVVNRVFAAWVAEAQRLPEFAALKATPYLKKQWFFDGTEHVDPAKEATAQGKKLANHTTTLSAEYAKEGKDWEVELRQKAKETKLLQELGLTEQEAAPKAPSKGEDKDNNEPKPPKPPKEVKRHAATRTAA